VTSPTQLDVTIPAESAGTVDIVVTNSDGLAARSRSAFTFSAAIPGNTSPPTISGRVFPNEILTASPGSWSLATSGFGYQWELATDALGSGLTMVGTNQSTYTVASSDLGKFLRVAVTPTSTTTTARSAFLPLLILKPSEAELANMSAAGPSKCGGGAGLAAFIGALSLTMLRQRRHRA
jgi:hypothetical protein